MFIDIYHDNETFLYKASSIISFLSPTAMPMTSQLDTEIAKAVEDIYAPDTDDRQRFPSELAIQSNHFDKQVDEIGRDICAPSQARYAESHRKHLANILLNLSRSIVTKRWTIFVDDPKAYSKEA